LETLQKTHTRSFVILGMLLLLTAFANIHLGSIHIPSGDIASILAGQPSPDKNWDYIVLNYRIPKAITAILVGSGLGISGLLMQTLFRNPLAGPFVLGISSGASLGVAFLLLGASLFGGVFAGIAQLSWSIALAASLGSFAVLGAVLLVVKKIRNTLSILIVGLMFGSISAAVINVLSYFSNAEQLQQFVFWSLGSLGNLSWKELVLFSGIVAFSIVLLLRSIKPLDSLLLLKKTRRSLVISTGLLTGVITAFAGPIAFVGLAVPHLTKLVFNTSSHKILLPAVALNGAILLLVCDAIAQLPNSEHTLPINAITSLFGAPIVIWLLVRKQKKYV
jgi:iron complex transport system permease protein